MWRREYDGSEWWEFSRPFTIPTKTEKIMHLAVHGNMVGWETLEDLNQGLS
jgi:hypothetical protein